MTETKNQLTAKIKEFTSLLSAAILGLGVGLIISIIFTKIGVWLILIGLAVKSSGPALSRLIPNMFKYQSVTCPYCRHSSQLRTNAASFSCDHCERLLMTEKGKVRLYKHLRLV